MTINIELLETAMGITGLNGTQALLRANLYKNELIAKVAEVRKAVAISAAKILQHITSFAAAIFTEKILK